MIRLTLNAKSDPEIHLFNKSVILIGSDSSNVDLLLTESSILPIHLKILEENGLYYAINENNDPFVLIDNQPFKKKLLRNEASIFIHDIEILFEHLPSEKTKDTNPVLSSSSPEPLIQLDLPFEKEVEVLKEGEWDQSEIDRLVEEEPKRKKTFSESTKDDHLKDLEDGYQNENSAFSSNESSHLYQAWKWILLFIFSTISISGIIGTVIFYSLNDKKEAQETKIAQGVADIAMALTHAHLHHLKPHNHNWSDVDFLKANLLALLPNDSSYASQLDGQGQFNCFPYNLRVYTNTDLSRFLLIAQPAPGQFYQVVRKSIVILDSESMELRSFKDVRAINRLLANSNPLDGVNGKEIFASVKEGKLIRLSVLAHESGHLDFAPPKNVAWIKPGAENAVYNAPRYYRLTQDLLQQAVALSTSKASSLEVTALKQKVDHFSRLNNLILYSDNKKSAVLSKQSLTLFAPSHNFLYGYLVLDHLGGIHQVHLIKNEDSKDVNPGQNQDIKPEFIAMSQPEVHLEHSEGLKIDVNHPVYIQLKALITMRENELRPLSVDFYNLLNGELDSPKAHFQTEFQHLFFSYTVANNRHKQLIKETLLNLYQQYADMPIEQFMGFIKNLRLNQLILQHDDAFTVIDENCIHNLENICTSIRECDSLLELDNLVHIAFSWLNFDHMKDPCELIKYQNMLRNNILEQLNNFLLSPEKPIVVAEGDKEILNHILEHGRLIKPDEREYFLDEFDELMHLQKSSHK